MPELRISFRKLQKLQKEQSKIHLNLLKTIDNLELTSSSVRTTQDHLGKFLVEISAFQQIATIVNELTESDVYIQEALSQVNEDIQSIVKIQRMARNLKIHLFQIKERVQREKSHLDSSVSRLSYIVRDFRERCKSDFIQFLKNLDYDLRKILKPLVPSSVIQESVNFPAINEAESLASSAALEIENFAEQRPEIEEKITENTTNKLNNHINMLVNTLETVAKDLIQLLSETDKKFHEFNDPSSIGSQPPTPLAAPLPEYFTFDLQTTHDRLLPKIEAPNIEQLRNKIKRLWQKGELDSAQADSLNRKLKTMIKNQTEFDFNTLFAGSELSMTKREEIVFKLLNSDVESTESFRLPLSTGRNAESNKQLDSVYKRKFAFQKRTREKLEEKLVLPQTKALNGLGGRNRKQLRVRSITPGSSDKSKKFRKVKTPIPKRVRVKQCQNQLLNRCFCVLRSEKKGDCIRLLEEGFEFILK